MSPKSDHPELRFNTSAASVGGALSGVFFAVGVPWVLLAYGQALGAPTQRVLVIAAIALGGFISLAAAVLGVVMPNEIRQPPPKPRAQSAAPEEVP